MTSRPKARERYQGANLSRELSTLQFRGRLNRQPFGCGVYALPVQILPAPARCRQRHCIHR